MSHSAMVREILGSARLQRAGRRILRRRTFLRPGLVGALAVRKYKGRESAMAECHRPHATSALSPGLCFLALWFLAVVCRGQDATSSELTAESQEIVVSATRIETPINEIGSSVTLIPAEEI